MTPDNFVKAQIAAFAYQEANHIGGHAAMLAVACVLRNRVKRGWQGGDWMRVLNAAGEHAALEPRMPKPIDMTAPAFKRVVSEIDEVYTGMFRDDLTGEKSCGLYYFDTLYEEHGGQVRPWFMEKILHDQVHHPRVSQVGTVYIFS